MQIKTTKENKITKCRKEYCTRIGELKYQNIYVIRRIITQKKCCNTIPNLYQVLFHYGLFQHTCVTFLLKQPVKKRHANKVDKCRANKYHTTVEGRRY